MYITSLSRYKSDEPLNCKTNLASKWSSWNVSPSFYQFSTVIHTNVLCTCLIFFHLWILDIQGSINTLFLLVPMFTLKCRLKFFWFFFFLIDSEPYEADGWQLWGWPPQILIPFQPNQPQALPWPGNVSLFFAFKVIFTTGSNYFELHVIFPDMLAVPWNKNSIPECSYKPELDVAVVSASLKTPEMWTNSSQYQSCY